MPSQLVEVMCASVLKNLDSFLRDYGVNHIVIRSLHSKAERCGISINELHDYGKAIQDDFNDDTFLNVAIRESNDINEVLAVSLQKATATTNQEMKNIKAEIKQLRAEQKAAQQAFHEFTTAAQTILEELKQLKSRQRSSPLKDRSRYTSPIRQCAMIENHLTFCS